ncbi:hypothetical protein PLICRDRAFT_577874 [Plicaturopsis crispa FD-325 SS-3]|nr:hypothetical protein PLICRDRAFT_577874 [Plicaturopsis crispa FD-325 SS-3]
MPTAPPASSVVPEDDKQQDGDPSKPDQPFSLHPDDPKNFLKLSTAITLLSKHTLLEHQIVEAELLIREYCTELITLYGPSVIKPNHHYATHVPDCARNFGPLHGFWTFLFERLNKVLKSFNTNNHSNGELETTFFQEFQRTCLSSRVTYMLSGYPPDSLQSRLAELMLKASNEDRGTVAALTTLSQELDDENQDAGKRFVLSPRYERKAMGSETYRLLASWINSRFPHLPVHCISERPQHLRSLPLNTVADYFDYVVLNATRYYSSAATGSNRSAMVEVDIKGDSSYSDLECGVVRRAATSLGYIPSSQCPFMGTSRTHGGIVGNKSRKGLGYHRTQKDWRYNTLD